ncbi:GntR family transcriptional regulator [Actinoplanes sp. NPDC048988]|uniref:GntR family transcriptional regulator n=1 Tax=Actinoplanes sp. NPDC048988 TaxID=3363901 RepID=UPI003722F88C
MTPSERMYLALRAAILHGDFAPRQPLKPQELATQHVVSLAVARETLLRLVGEGLADRLPNRGFAVPDTGDERWQQIAEARATVEPAMLRMAIERGDLEWEVRVRAAHHRLARATPYEQDPDGWSEAHRLFHRTLLEACGNDVLMGTFDRLWTDSELARRWSAVKGPARDAAAEHLALEEAVLAREADRAAGLLRHHVTRTVKPLTRS